MNFENLFQKIQLKNEFFFLPTEVESENSVLSSQLNLNVENIEQSFSSNNFSSPKSLWLYGLTKKGKAVLQKKYPSPISLVSSENDKNSSFYVDKSTRKNQNTQDQILVNDPVRIFRTKRNLYTSYSKTSEIRYVSIDLASSQTMKHWAEKTLPNGKILGEVTSANTLHHKSFKPLKGGLFCERIFGPMKDFECACGTRQRPSEEEYQKILEHRQTQRKFCPVCDVEYTWSIIRRYQMGYIQLASPVTHIWYLKANPSYLSILLDIKRSHLENIVYCSQTLTLENGFKASQVFLPLSPSNLFKSWQKILSGSPAYSSNFPVGKNKRWLGGAKEIQTFKVQNFVSKTKSTGLLLFPVGVASQQKRKDEENQLYLKTNKYVRNSLYFQRILNSFSFSPSFCYANDSPPGSKRNQQLENKETNGFFSYAFESFPYVVPLRGNVAKEKTKNKGKFLRIRGSSSVKKSKNLYTLHLERILQNFYKNALKISQFRKHRILDHIFFKLQQNKIELNSISMEPSHFESVKEERLMRIFLFCLQKQIFSKYTAFSFASSTGTLSSPVEELNQTRGENKSSFEKGYQEKKQEDFQTKKNGTAEPVLLVPDGKNQQLVDWIQKNSSFQSNGYPSRDSSLLNLKKEETMTDFSFMGTPPLQSTPVNGKKIDFIRLGDEDSVPISVASLFSGSLKVHKTEDSSDFCFFAPLPYGLLRSPTGIKSIRERNWDVFSKKNRFLIVSISLYLTRWTLQKQILRSLREKSRMKDAKKTIQLSYFKKQKNIKRKFQHLCKSTSKRKQNFSFSESSKIQKSRVVENGLKMKKIEKNVSFSKWDLQKKIRKNRNKWKSGSLGFRSVHMRGHHMLKQKNQILDFLYPREKGQETCAFDPRRGAKQPVREKAKVKSVKKISFSFPKFVLPFSRTGQKAQEQNPTGLLCNKTISITKNENFQKRQPKREIKVKILAQQMTKQDKFWKSYFFILPSFAPVPLKGFASQHKAKIEVDDSISSSTYPSYSIATKRKFQDFLRNQQKQENIPTFAFSRTGPKAQVQKHKEHEKKYRRKNERKAKHCDDFLRNNIYCLSHRYRWGNDQFWQYFSYYSLAHRDFDDSIIPVYQNRFAGAFFPSFSSSFSSHDPSLLVRVEEQNRTFLQSFAKQSVRGAKERSSDFGNLQGYQKRKEKKSPTTFSTGAGILQKLFSEFEPEMGGENSELKKLDQQNRIFLNEFNRKIHLLKTLAKRGFAEKSEKKQLKELCQKRDQLVARTKLVRAFSQKKTSPNSMILTTLPVLPPDLRPILKIQNQIAASDLNRLYQRVIYRNDRLKKFKKDLSLSYSFEIQYAQKLLQEAVDNLIQNGKGGNTPERDARGRPLKSLSEILKGKGGRFRQYLLGKRVDYSGRSVIVVGPSLKLHECGLPREIALELFLPFLIQRIIHYKFSRTVIGAKTFIQTNKNFTNSILSEIMQSFPILLNRAPTLHRLGFQAFQPKLVEGRAILLHPLVCPAFNADFDGDQMAVHIPLTVEARAEAWKLMFARNHLMNSSTGEPIILPSQDMVLGCYYLTTEIATYASFKEEEVLNLEKSSIPLFSERVASQQKQKERTKISYFTSFDQVLKLYQLQLLKTHENVWVKWKKPVNTFDKLLNTQMVSPREIRILKNGNWQEIRPKYIRWFNVDYFVIQQYICTTPGRILFYQMTQKCISNVS